MSAITGIFYRDGRSLDPELIKKMNDKLSHRGPDGSSTWCEGPIGLGHQMLWTTQESLHETLPFKENGLVITADARIDNRKELSAELGIDDKEHVSDSYFILKAYQKWGEDCPDKLLGDFAFAIWDKNEEKLFCARDPFGVKPFYYYLSDDVFFFSTEIRAIQGLDEVPHKLNHLMAAFYLIPNADDINITFYEDIMRLPAANRVLIDSKHIEFIKYWELDYNLKIQLESDDEYLKKFHNLLNQAVKCRSRSSFPIGFELSGGLDSSSIVSSAKNNINKDDLLNKSNNLKTFSLITNDFPNSDESYYINKIVEKGGIEPYFLYVDHINPLDEAEKISWHLEQPLFSPNVTLFWNLYKKMQDQGIRVLFRGYDGDAVLSQGQFYFKELFLNLKWKKLIKEIRGYSDRVNKTPLELLLNKCIFPIVPSFFKKIWKKTKKTRDEGDLVLENKELIKRIDLKKKYKIFDRSSFNPNTAREFHYNLINLGSHQFSFEFLDKLNAAFLIEPRYPFFDKRLVEFCYAIPTNQKFKLGWDRTILRESMTNLPQEVRWRPLKRFLTPVFEKNFIKFEKKSIEKLIFEDEQIYNIFARPEEVKEIYENYKNHSPDYKLSDARDIWKLVTLVMWIKKEKIRI